MCGIILADLNKKAAKRLMKRYNKQQSRGKEGYGCISIDNGIIKNIYRSKSEGEIRKKRTFTIFQQTRANRFFILKDGLVKVFELTLVFILLGKNIKNILGSFFYSELVFIYTFRIDLHFPFMCINQQKPFF